MGQEVTPRNQTVQEVDYSETCYSGHLKIWTPVKLSHRCMTRGPKGAQAPSLLVSIGGKYHTSIYMFSMLLMYIRSM